MQWIALAIAFAGAGAVALTHPDGDRLLSERLLARSPDWALRCAAAVGVARGAWLVDPSSTSA
jgi:hypothetical protein